MDIFMQVDAPVAKAVGAYERELEPVISSALHSQLPRFIDIGAAEGYYAVGFALRSPQAEVHAFEIDGWARRRLHRLAASNRVGDRVHIYKECTATDLLELPTDAAFVLCDCEGAETQILTPGVARHLGSSTVLVELHDEAAGADVSKILGSRFQSTHQMSMITRRTGADEQWEERHRAALSSLTAEERRIALEEFRGEPPKWAIFTPRHESRSSHARS